jgi:hypothetical protein
MEGRTRSQTRQPRAIGEGVGPVMLLPRCSRLPRPALVIPEGHVTISDGVVPAFAR